MKRLLRYPLGTVVLAWMAMLGHAADPVQPAAPTPPGAIPTYIIPAEPVPPLAIVPAEHHACPLWDSLVALHNSYAYHYDSFDALAPTPCSGGVHFFADPGFYFLQPYFESNPSSTFVRHSLTDAGTPTTSTRSDEFQYDTSFAPRLDLGVVGQSGLGVRASWWRFDQVARTRPTADLDRTGNTLLGSAAVAGVPGFTSPSAAALKFGVFKEQLAFNAHLNLSVYDLEAMQQSRTDLWTLLFSGGVRYAYLSQYYSATRFNSGNGTSGKTKVNVLQDFDMVQDGHSFAGLGPTVSLDASRPIGILGFGLYGTARTSALFGIGKFQSFQDSATTVLPVGTKSTKPLVSTTLLALNNGTERDDVLPIGEVEIGGEWTQRFGRFGVFGRVGLVGQTWVGAGNATGETGTLGFFGMTLTGGAEY